MINRQKRNLVVIFMPDKCILLNMIFFKNDTARRCVKNVPLKCFASRAMPLLLSFIILFPYSVLCRVAWGLEVVKSRARRWKQNWFCR